MATGRTQFGGSPFRKFRRVVSPPDLSLVVGAPPGYARASTATTLKLVMVHGPKEVTMATSVASRPRPIKMRPIRRVLCRASNVNQRSRAQRV
jgi:hypothetical protein